MSQSVEKSGKSFSILKWIGIVAFFAAAAYIIKVVLRVFREENARTAEGGSEEHLGA